MNKLDSNTQKCVVREVYRTELSLYSQISFLTYTETGVPVDVEIIKKHFVPFFFFGLFSLFLSS